MRKRFIQMPSFQLMKDFEEINPRYYAVSLVSHTTGTSFTELFMYYPNKPDMIHEDSRLWGCSLASSIPGHNWKLRITPVSRYVFESFMLNDKTFTDVVTAPLYEG